MQRWIAVALIVLGISTPAIAWGPAGHKIIASIAFRQLSVAEQNRFVDLLKHHPRFDVDFKRQMPAEVAADDDAAKREWYFQQAAFWPDLLKSLNDDVRNRYHRDSWHYINNPHFLADEDRTALSKGIKGNVSLNPPAALSEQTNVIQMLRYARSVVGDSSAPADERAVMLCWLLHGVGDIHQPLHSTALFSRNLFPKGDRGGSWVTTTQRRNLHSLWDSFPGGEVTFTEARNQGIELASIPELSKVRDAAAKKLNEADWMAESIEISKNVAYGTEVHKALEQLERKKADPRQFPLTLSEAYLAEGGEISRIRLVEAGVRLGTVLKSVADPKHAESKNASTGAAKPGAPKPAAANSKPTTPAKPTAPAKRYWLNTASNVRHNDKCEHFQKTARGRFCTATDGTACSKCGG